MTRDGDIILLDVGGSVFKTTRSTLRSIPNTRLAELVSLPNGYSSQVGDEVFGISADSITKTPPLSPERGKEPNSPETSADSGYNGSNLSFSLERRFADFMSPDDSNFPNNISFHDADKIVCNMGDIKVEVEKPPAETVSEHDSRFLAVVPEVGTSRCNSVRKRRKLSKRKKAAEKYFFDQDPVFFPYILSAYRNGELHLPRNMCSLLIRAELKYWKLPEDMISECCWKDFMEGLKAIDVVDTIDRCLHDPYARPEEIKKLSTLGKIWLTMERPGYNTISKIWNILYFICIILSCILFTIESSEENRELKDEFLPLVIKKRRANETVQYLDMIAWSKATFFFEHADHFFKVFFTVELLVRFITCPSKLGFVKSVHNIIDFLIVLLFWIHFLLDLYITEDAENYDSLRRNAVVVLKCFMVLRVLRVFHLTKHISGLKVMYLSVRASVTELCLLFAVVGVFVLLFGTLVFTMEVFAENEADITFYNIPIAMWWALITMTTVGYGDFYPQSLGGYIIGALCAMSGVLLLAMPVAILAANFSTYYENMDSRDHRHRRISFMQMIKFQSTTEKDETASQTCSPSSKGTQTTYHSNQAVKNDRLDSSDLDDNIPQKNVVFASSLGNTHSSHSSFKHENTPNLREDQIVRNEDIENAVSKVSIFNSSVEKERCHQANAKPRNKPSRYKDCTEEREHITMDEISSHHALKVPTTLPTYKQADKYRPSTDNICDEFDNSKNLTMPEVRHEKVSSCSTEFHDRDSSRHNRQKQHKKHATDNINKLSRKDHNYENLEEYDVFDSKEIFDKNQNNNSRSNNNTNNSRINNNNNNNNKLFDDVHKRNENDTSKKKKFIVI